MTCERRHFRHFAFALLAFALAVRALVPAGWMPSGERAFAVTICTGIDTQTMWLDSKGEFHKSDPSKKGHRDDGDEQGCAFAGLGSPMLPEVAIADIVAAAPTAQIWPSTVLVSAIGQGLAAPPPPSTGPPLLT